jgi:hypothetical protein
VKRRLLVGGVVVTLAVLATVAVAVRAPGRRTRIRCEPASRGEYAALARIDADGYVYPFAGVALDEGGRWELVIDDVHDGTTRIAGRSRIGQLQRVRFGCTGGDYGTPETSVRVLRGGALVYAADVVAGEGLQLEEFGFVEPSNRLAFWWASRPW